MKLVNNKLSLDEYLRLPYKLELIPDCVEGGYAAKFPDLPGCLSYGETIPECIAMANDAKITWLTDAFESEKLIPLPSQLDEYSGQLRIRMPKSLHRALAEKSKTEHISMNQYCIYLLSKGIQNG